MPAILPQIPFRLHTAQWGDEGLVVAQFTAREEISRPYVVDLLALAREPVALEDLPQIGQPATLAIAAGDTDESEPRRFHGVLSRVTHDGVAHDRGGAWLRVRVAPRLWTLKYRRTRRVFQDRTALQVLDAVLGAHAVPWRFTIDAQLPVMAYCVQHDETDFAFVHRLLARFGLFYFFEQGNADHGNDGATETMVVCDAARHYPALAGGRGSEPRVLKLVDRSGTYRPVEAVMTFSHTRRGRPTSARLRDWEFTSPNTFGDALETPPNVEPSLGADTLQVDEFDYRSGNDTIRVRRRDARTVLEQHRADAIVGTGTSDCPAFAPGSRWLLNNHDVSRLNTAWVTTRVEHEGIVPELSREPTSGRPVQLPPVYTNRFTCAPADIPVRPARPAPRRSPTTSSAVVVGPEGEEIYVDHLGRIKAQFLWDRAGTYGERSSCWLRVLQPWAGPGWGFQFLPRVGMEVLVTYLDGDPDHPVVLGALHNAMRMPTHALPESKSRSGIRTQSTPGGEGFNELAFEDAAGAEQVLLHAQRDLVEHVNLNHATHVGANETNEVLAHRVDSVHGDERRSVGGNRFDQVQGNRVEHVTGNAELSIARDLTERVEGDRQTMVRGSVDEQITHGYTRVVNDNARDDVGSLNIRVRGNEQAVVLGSAVVRVGAADAKRPYALHVEGRTTISSAQATEIESTESVTIRCGPNSIHLTPEGVTISGKRLVFASEGATVRMTKSLKAVADNHLILKGDDVLVRGSGSAAKFASDVKIDGSAIKLKSPVQGPDDETDPAIQPTHIELVDENGRPLAGHPFFIVGADGTRRAGVLDGGGKATVHLDAGAHIEFPEAADAGAS